MKKLAVLAAAAFVSTLAMADDGIVPDTKAAVQDMTAGQIIEKNVAARGGLDAWRKVQSMIWVGHIESARAMGQNLPFVLEMKNPNKTRFEVKSQGADSVRIYDGAHGWKVHTSASGRPELEPYSREELSFERDAQGVGEPLIDYQAKGISVALEGADDVEGRKAYRLRVTMPSGVSHHMWIDAQTFLDIKYDRESRNAFGQVGTISMFYRNYALVDGLQIPMVIESGPGKSIQAIPAQAKGGQATRADTAGTGGVTAAGNAPPRLTDKMVIHKVVLNPPLDDRAFAKPAVPWSHRGALVDSRQPPAPRLPPSLRVFQSSPSRAPSGSGGAE